MIVQFTLSHLPFGEKPNSNHTQPPYSLDLTLCNFRLFLELKMGLSCHWFVSMEEMQQNVTASLRTIPEQDF
ncbi:hypothetical protein B7P43_G04242 [Cryptotermes secundus]|uniref:Uncharacterized protein n=1 Tax=Cryptotermes secundus TaxID=105785 RepID=A0A2J7QNF0_9NEOP|nr:hypothetical protein B7P43_G04242 [Cryptotermes secundus]